VDTIHELVGQFPALTFVLLHGGGSWILQLAEAIRDCPNAFLDISFTLQRYRTSSVTADLQYLVSNFDRRLIFGSDFPEISIASALATFHEITEGISSEKRTNVLEANLGRILD
jgi:predicted TIM-barrel fold metal-dependent hydrolase